MRSAITFVHDYERFCADFLATYNYYILNTTATFQISQITPQELETVLKAEKSLYVTWAVLSDDVYAGYCRLAPFNRREAYSQTAELTIYLDPQFCGKGIGREAVSFLENLALSRRLHTLLACISAENTASTALFERCGYKKCGHIVDAGFKFDRYIDTVYYQKIL